MQNTENYLQKRSTKAIKPIQIQGINSYYHAVNKTRVTNS